MIPAILLFVSGAAALVYQTLWVKQLGLVVGVDVYAVTIAVSAFFAGLATGGAAIGRWADRTRQPFRVYAILELGVAALGVGATLALACADRAFVALELSAGPLAWALPFLAVSLPAFLMGATFPAIISGATQSSPSKRAARTGFLYSTNTVGAALGCFAAGYHLLLELGK